MRLLEATAAPFSLRLRTALVTSRATYRVREGIRIVLSAVTAEGRLLRGEGEATPLVEFGTERYAEATAAIDAALEQLRGGTLPLDPAGLELRATPAARFGLETALLSLLAQARGVSLARLLSSGADLTPVRVAALLDAQDAIELGRQARAAVEAGHEAVKVKVGAAPLEVDVARIEAVREAVGPAVAIRADANGAWSVAQALTALERLRPFALELCEQPVAPTDLAGLRELKRTGLCPIAADEAVPSLRCEEKLAEYADVLVLKPTVLGGMLPSLELARRAARAGVRSYVSSALEGPVARAALAHLAAALGQPALAAGLGDAGLFEGRPPFASAVVLGDGAAARPAVVCPIGRYAARSPESTAVAFEGRRLSYRELDEAVRHWTGLLEAEAVGPGDRVCVVAHNRPDVVALWFALMRRGAALVPLNARSTAAELAVARELAGPRLTFAEPELIEAVPGALPLAPPSTSATPGPATLELDATAVILFTSGTTGVPKAVRLTVANLLASAEASRARVGGDASDRWLGSLPLFHVGGLAMAFRALQYGAALHLLRRFDPAAALAAVRDDGITHASFVPTTLQRLVEGVDASPRSSLRAVLVGGGPVRPELIQQARRLGIPALQTYGLTEACSQVCTELPGEADGTTAGPPLLGVEVRIVDGERAPLPPGREGEIQVRGPTVMKGYLGAPEHDGWLRTFDLGAIDERGRLTVCARRTDLILSGGENVYPAELEATLMRHPAVRDAGVTSVDDERWGQVPVALVALSDAGALEELPAFCRSQLAGFKIPRRFVPVDSLPRNANGKLDRRALRGML